MTVNNTGDVYMCELTRRNWMPIPGHPHGGYSIISTSRLRICFAVPYWCTGTKAANAFLSSYLRRHLPGWHFVDMKQTTQKPAGPLK